jgi:hypothetical protein
LPPPRRARRPMKFVDVCVSPSKLNRLLPMGLLMLGAGLLLDVWTHGDHAPSVAGFWLATSAVLIRFGFVPQNPEALG